jgi:hypothetical protein
MHRHGSQIPKLTIKDQEPGRASQLGHPAFAMALDVTDAGSVGIVRRMVGHVGSCKQRCSAPRRRCAVAATDLPVV